jgi:hypothetical protein
MEIKEVFSNMDAAAGALAARRSIVCVGDVVVWDVGTTSRTSPPRTMKWPAIVMGLTVRCFGAQSGSVYWDPENTGRATGKQCSVIATLLTPRFGIRNVNLRFIRRPRIVRS